MAQTKNQKRMKAMLILQKEIEDHERRFQDWNKHLIAPWVLRHITRCKQEISNIKRNMGMPK